MQIRKDLTRDFQEFASFAKHYRNRAGLKLDTSPESVGGIVGKGHACPAVCKRNLQIRRPDWVSHVAPN